MVHAQNPTNQTIEYSCWILSALIAAVLVYIICSEMNRAPSGPSDKRVASSKRSYNSTKSSSKNTASSRHAMVAHDYNPNAHPNQGSQCNQGNPDDSMLASNFMNTSHPKDEQHINSAPNTIKLWLAQIPIALIHL